MRRNTLFGFVLLLLSVAIVTACDDELPTKVIATDIPAYYFENHYLENRVDVINDAIEACTDGCETFFWITDIHWESDLNTRKAPLLIKYIASKTGVNKVLNGGDTGNSQLICKNAILQLRNAIGSNRVYTVTGNHEIVDASRYERPFKRVAEELRGHNTDISYGDEDQSYFYFDNYENKTRYIGLSSFGLYINDECEQSYTIEQLDWFKNVALNVLEGWQILIFTHSLYYISVSTNKIGTSPLGASSFIEAIDNYQGKGIISCVLMGHSHIDRLHIGRTGIPYVISACDRYSAYQGDINVNRVPGTISEQHFEVVIIDKGKRQIKFVSIGANARDGYDDDSGNEVNMRMVNY